MAPEIKCPVKSKVGRHRGNRAATCVRTSCMGSIFSVG